MRYPRILETTLCALVAGAFVATAALAQEKKPAAEEKKPAPPTYTFHSAHGKELKTEEHLIEIDATVVSIDLPRREVTLKGPEGRVETLELGPDVRRITEIKAGDLVHVQYYLGMAAEIRTPTEEEKKEPYKVMDDTLRAPKTEAPAGIKARTIRVVATVESVDAGNHTVTLVGPKGNSYTVQVEDPAVMAKAKKGDTVIVTAAEALAMSIEKVDKGAKGEKK